MLSIFLRAACPKGRFGQNCRQECDCGEAACDAVSGECLCQPGYTGPKCLEGDLSLFSLFSVFAPIP